MELAASECVETLETLNPLLIGTSLGHYHSYGDDWKSAAEQARAYRLQGLELVVRAGWTGDDETGGLYALADELAASGRSVAYLSLHAPTVDSESIANALAAVAPHVDAVVVHPDHLPRPQLLAPLGVKVAIENMDRPDRYGSTVTELEAVFEQLPEARFCLDIAHADRLDPTQQLAHQLLDRFGTRLAQLHLSQLSYATCNHLPLTGTAIERMRPALERCRQVPWMLEAPFADGPCDKHECSRCGLERV